MTYAPLVLQIGIPVGTIAAHLSVNSWLGIAGELLTGIICLFTILGLRSRHRGAARFGMTPAAAILVLLPVALGCGLTALELRRTLGSIAPIGSGGLAAIAAGAVESMITMLIGIAVGTGLAFVSVFVVGVGTRRCEDVRPGRGGWGLLIAIVAVGLTAAHVAIVLRVIGAATVPPLDTQAIAVRWRIAAMASGLLPPLLFAAIVATAVSSPRGPFSGRIKTMSVSLLLMLALGGVGGFWASHDRFSCLTATALTGVYRNALPEVASASREMRVAPEAAPPLPLPLAADERPHGAVSGLPAAPEVPQALRVGSSIREPMKVKHVSPLYPDLAKQARIEGTVVLECTINEQGQVTEVRVLRGIPLLDAAAVEAVRQWVYSPTLLEGVPVPVIMTVTVHFKLS